MALGTFTPNLTTTTKRERTARNQTRGDVAPAVRDSLLAVANHASTNAPRNLQKRIGPSEIGEPCSRQVAHKLAGTPEVRHAFTDPWPSIVGTAVHAWLDKALQSANQAMGFERWLSEQTVTVAEGILAGCGAGSHLTGSCDCYDRYLSTVVDFKVLGTTQHAEYLTGYVSHKYRVQIHCYGLGLANLGYPVEHVALAVFGRAKRLDDLYVYSEPWDRSIAEDAIDRLAKIQTVVSGGIDPMQVRATPSRQGCYFCPWRPTCPEAQKGH